MDEKKDGANSVRSNAWLELPDADGLITSINGKQLDKPIPFKKGDNLTVKAKLPDENGNFGFEWIEF